MPVTSPFPSASPNPGTLCVPLPHGREFVLPGYLPVAVIVIVLVVLGYDVTAAVTAVAAMGGAARALTQAH